MNGEEIVVVGAARTPFGRYCGSLRDMDYFDLGAVPMKEVLNRLNLEGNVVDEVFWGGGRYLGLQRCLYAGGGEADIIEGRTAG